jgi:serine/threonine protein kinase
MARVYRAHQDRLDRDVAIKILPPYYASDPDFVERFKQEARALARFSHPNIVVVHDAGEEHGLLFIIMEYVAGGNLREYMRQSITLSEVTRIIREVAGALTYAHERGIIHRDVKPVNVLMDTNKRAVLSDFGIAKVIASSAVAISRSGAGVGTPEYMSPEQCRGGQVDARTDIYALGVMLYEMLTSHTPFEADNYTALAHSHIYEPPPPPSRYNPRVSPAVQAVVLKALEKSPADRFQSAVEMAVALEQAVATQSPLPPGERRQTDAMSVVDDDAAPRQTGQQVLVCPRCQAPNYASQRFCSTCGQPFGGPGQGPPSGPIPSHGPALGAYGAMGARQPNSRGLVCPDCHTPNPPLYRFCISCGASLLHGVAGKTCRRCNARNAAGARFCTKCGADLS